MKYAVIKSGGKQYKVSEGDVIELDRLPQAEGKVTFEDVLLVVSDNGIKIGKPTVNGEKIEGKILEHIKGDKIRVSKFKSKVRYRRTNGFRASLTKVEILPFGAKIKEEKKVEKTVKKS